MNVGTLSRELERRGYRVVRLSADPDHVTVSVDVMNGRDPMWLKAVQVPTHRGSPDHLCAELKAWQAKVLTELAAGQPSPIVRRMIAEHGQDAVVKALRGPQ